MVAFLAPPPPGSPSAGVNCEVNIDDCASNPCTFGICRDAINRYDCVCQPGFTGGPAAAVGRGFLEGEGEITHLSWGGGFAPSLCTGLSSEIVHTLGSLCLSQSCPHIGLSLSWNIDKGVLMEGGGVSERARCNLQ